VPADKTVVGMPFYARQYAHVGAANGGLYQPFDDTGLDPNTLQWDATPTPTYRDLVDVAKIVTPSSAVGNDAKGLAGFTRSWDPLAGEPWLYSAAQQRFISYDDPHSIAERAQAINARQLRGAMVWEISQDSDDHALLGALDQLLR
jgi:chitinase